MPFGELAAVTLQTILIVIFIAILTPLRYSVKKTGFVLFVTALTLCIAAGCMAAWRETSFLATYGFILLGTPLFLTFRLLSTAKGFRFLFVVFTAILFHHMLSTLLAVFRIWAGGDYTLLYLFLSVLAFALLATGGVIMRKDFHSIVRVYQYEFVCLTPILLLLFGLSYLFSPISEHRCVLDPDLLLLTLGIDLLIVLLYLYIGVSFHSLGKHCYDTREDTVLRLSKQESENHISLLRSAQEKVIVSRHNLHRHLSRIQTYLDSGELDKLQSYLTEAQAEAAQDQPKKYCQNEAANLLILSFVAKAADVGLRLAVTDAQLPHSLPTGNPELCTLLSNALENAIAAAERVDMAECRTITLMARLTGGKLLIQVAYPYAGMVHMEDGLPLSGNTDEDLRFASIISIVKKHGGLSSFEAADGLFRLRIVI